MNFIEVYTQLLDELRSVRETNKEFLRQLESDELMMVEFTEWCNENGYRRKSEALEELADSLIEQRESVWESLKDYDNEE